jgi:hypothetical protein
VFYSHNPTSRHVTSLHIQVHTPLQPLPPTTPSTQKHRKRILLLRHKSRLLQCHFRGNSLLLPGGHGNIGCSGWLLRYPPSWPIIPTCVDICWIGNGALHAETYEALEKVKASCYAHSVTDADRENILSLEKSLSMEAKFCQEAKKKWFPEESFPHIHRLFSPLPWKTIDQDSTVFDLRYIDMYCVCVSYV